MTRAILTRQLLVATAMLGLVSAAGAADPSRAVAPPEATGHLVSPEWLERQLPASSVLLLDASMPQQHAAGHIAGAVPADAFAFAGREVPAAEVERRLRAWGVGTGRPIVVYDEGGSWLAMRLVYDLYYHGVPAADLRVLDGGLTRWRAAGKSVTQERTPAPAAGDFRVARVLDAVRVRLPEFLVATGDPVNHAVVDALDPPYYYGGAKFFDRGGHVPHALLWPASDFFNPDKTFKSPDEIRRMAAHLGLQPHQTVHVYCGGGGAAAVPFFALHFVLGRDRVKLYNESQREWLRDERGLPLWTHATPSMLRRMAWLDGWASPMLRTFGFAQISVVDVRSPEAYRQGHVPFAVNVPAEAFAAQLQQSDHKLAALLGASGIDVEHEAVIVADGRLTPPVALAYWMLERMGQSKVSLLVDSMDEWAFGGLPTTREPTVVGVRRTPQDVAVPAATYPTDRVRAGTLSPPDRSREATMPPAYPTVYLAAGKQPPTRAPAGAEAARPIRLPYTELLDANGMPKAAKELWSLLAKAGVPRYAQIVSFADDPGEAAVGYFVLKLMGFADVKLDLTTSAARAPRMP